VRLVKWLVPILLVGVVAFFVLRWFVQQASPLPEGLGVSADGRLADCPPSPNCVSTFATDAEHSMEAIPYDGATAVAHDAILAILRATPHFTIITDDPTYIHAEARSAAWGFIDDVEFYFDENNSLIHFRSASRLGYGDGGVNRARMAKIVAAYRD
jgi:uncharacterized protein (DUF1499 family)